MREDALPPALALREVAAADEPFLRELYRSVRDPELALTSWSEEQKRAFSNQQFDFQDRWYRSQYPGARFLVIEREGSPIGRIYLHETANETGVMDIALVAAARNAGLGTALMEWVKAGAAARGAAVTLHVEIFNPARSLYARLGFREESTQGMHTAMRWDPATAG
jgi:GNAT superfamily N-acetyltransferase